MLLFPCSVPSGSSFVYLFLSAVLGNSTDDFSFALSFLLLIIRELFIGTDAPIVPSEPSPLCPMPSIRIGRIVVRQESMQGGPSRCEIPEEGEVFPSSQIVDVAKDSAFSFCKAPVLICICILYRRFGLRDKEKMVSTHDDEANAHDESQEKSEEDKRSRHKWMVPRVKEMDCFPKLSPSCCYDDHAACTEVDEEQNKVALIVEANTLVEPRTVVVVLDDTCLAYRAVMGALWFGRRHECVGL